MSSHVFGGYGRGRFLQVIVPLDVALNCNCIFTGECCSTREGWNVNIVVKCVYWASVEILHVTGNLTLRSFLVRSVCSCSFRGGT